MENSPTPDVTQTPTDTPVVIVSGIEQAPKRKKLPLTVLIPLVAVALVGAAFLLLRSKPNPVADTSATPTPTAAASATPAGIKISVKEEGKKILTGGYADPTIVPTATGYRMYVNRQSGGPSGYLTFTSPDGITFTKEKESVISGVATGRAVVLPTGIRFYYPGMQPIKATDPQADMYSSFSADGVSFTKDPGVILKPQEGYYVEGPTVFQLPDKSWRMYFNENSVAAGNQRDGIIWGASSKDGLTWTRDSKPTFEASATEAKAGNWKQVLHPFVVTNPKGGYIMFYNSHSEMYAATSTDGIMWEKIGKIGIHGADFDGYFQADGTFRAYYGDFDEATGGLVYMAVLNVE